MKNQTRLDTMDHAQRAAFARRLYGRIRLPHSTGTRLLMERLAKGGAR